MGGGTGNAADCAAAERAGAAWEAFQTRRHRLEPPLCPTPQVIEAMRAAVGVVQPPILLLGVTPAIVAGFDDLLVLDWSPAARSVVSPAQVIAGDWLDPPLAEASCGAALGDGSLSCLIWPDEYARLLDRLSRLVRPGGRVAFRCYVAPERADAPEQLAAAAMTGAGGGFAAFKWRLAMALASEADANIPVAAIACRFDALFPDRAELAAAAGWTPEAIDDIDAYRDAPLSYSFPTRRQLLAMARRFFATAGWVETAGYELAERCPLLVMERTA